MQLKVPIDVMEDLTKLNAEFSMELFTLSKIVHSTFLKEL